MATSSSTPVHPLESSSRLPASAVAALCECDAICMDVDSTVCTSEAIDELAAFAGVKDAVAAMTARAMSGSQSFTDALRSRLALIRPSRDMLARFTATHDLKLTPGVEDFIRTSVGRGVPVYLVSGGFTALIAAMVRAKGLSDVIPLERIFANVIVTHDETGEYLKFDETAPTSQDGGKATVVRNLMTAAWTGPRARLHTHVCMIGDGVTDAQARPPARVFVGYGGIAVREKVQAAADAYVYSFHTLREAMLAWDREHDTAGVKRQARLDALARGAVRK